MDSTGGQPTSPRFYRTSLAAITILFLLLASGGAFTRRPGGDEVFTANSAKSLAFLGKSGMTVMEPTGLGNKPGTNLIRINEHNYHIMPLSFVGQAAWFKMFGFSILATRFYSVFWGVVLLLSWSYSIRKLTADQNLALLTTFFLAIDFLFVQSSTDGRPDMMGASLGAVGLALYLGLRERSLGRAIFAGVAMLTLAVFTHPIAAMAAVPLGLAYLLLDARRFHWSHVLLAATPFLIGAGAYGLFILQDPVAFQAQFGANASGRLVGLAHPLEAIRREIGLRYMENLYLPHYARGVAVLRIFVILSYWSAALWIALSGRLRNDPRHWLVLLTIAIQFLLFTIFEGNKNSYYLVHIMPFYAAALAICLMHIRTMGPALRMAGNLMVIVLSLLQLSWIGLSVVKNPYKNSYIPAIAFLREHAGTSGTITGSGELGFALGFEGNLRDDSTLGFYSGRKSDFIVIDENMYKQSLSAYGVKIPALDVYVKHLLADEYHRVYDGPYYEIYQRNGKM